jgi:Glycosyl transferase family 2
MSEPKLTIGIPHLDRTKLLQHAIDSCLAQTVPVRIIVADQGGTEETQQLLDRYADHPEVHHYRTDATNLWQNWKAVAKACVTPYFAWLQDDDQVERIYAKRIIQAFESYPEALHWQANCQCASDPDRLRYVRKGWNGPQWHVRRGGGAEQWPGRLIPASMYILSWALSPGVAFRCGQQFTLALDGMPDDCDLFAERLILAAMAAQGPWVADSVIAGYWNHHGENESYKQNANGDQARQRTVMVENLDSILDGFPAWEEGFYQWLVNYCNPQEIVGWIKGFECDESRYADQLKRVMGASLEGRVTEMPEELRQVLAPVPQVDDLVLIYE